MEEIKMEEIKKKLEMIKTQIREEVEKVQHELSIDVPQALHKAAAQGDLRENAEYEAAKDRQSFLQSRLAQLYAKLKMISAIDFDFFPKDRVTIFSSVTIRNCDTEEEETFYISLSEMIDPMKRTNEISYGSPVARVLLDQHCGEIVEINRGGKVQEWEIIRIKNVWGKEITAS